MQRYIELVPTELPLRKGIIVASKDARSKKKKRDYKNSDCYDRNKSEDENNSDDDGDNDENKRKRHGGLESEVYTYLKDDAFDAVEEIVCHTLSQRPRTHSWNSIELSQFVHKMEPLEPM